MDLLYNTLDFFSGVLYRGVIFMKNREKRKLNDKLKIERDKKVNELSKKILFSAGKKKLELKEEMKKMKKEYREKIKDGENG